jgi:nicotinamide-nucleotide amidase
MLTDIETASTACVQALAEALLVRGWRLASAESCTGGLIAACCTALPGASRWFERGVVSYSNAAKSECLDVPLAMFERCGAVSREVACAMVAGLLARSPAEVAVAVTGIAGPDGGSELKPVGTVWLAWGLRGAGGPEAVRLDLAGDRRAVRHATVLEALQRLTRRVAAG